MSLYAPVKYALMIILAVGLALCVVNLTDVAKKNNNAGQIVVIALELFALLVGFFGAYRGSRQLLLTYFIIMIVLVIFLVVQNQTALTVSNSVLHIISVVLAFWQSEMIRTRDF